MEEEQSKHGWGHTLARLLIWIQVKVFFWLQLWAVVEAKSPSIEILCISHYCCWGSGWSSQTFTFTTIVHLLLFGLSSLLDSTPRHGVVFHRVLVADSGFVVHNGWRFEAVPAPEHSELIILTYCGKSNSPLSGSRRRSIPLLSVCVTLKGLESGWKAQGIMFGITYWIVLLPQSRGDEPHIYLLSKISNFARTQCSEQATESGFGQRSRSWQGFAVWRRMCYPYDILPIWQTVRSLSHIS